jgi:hypothetical protein
MSWRDRATPVGGKSDWKTRALPVEEVENEPKTGAFEAGLEHYGNAATLGYLPHIQAATEPAFNKVMDLITGGNVSEGDDRDYLKRRDENLKRIELEGKEHPVASGLGTVGGIVASAVAPMGSAAKGATLGAKALQGAKVGGALGAAANPGDIEGEVSPLQVGGRLKNAAIGSAVGAAIPTALEGVKSGSQKVADFLRTKAALKATRSLGRPTPTQAKNMAASGQDEILGRELLDSGAIPYLGTPKRIQTRVEGLKEKAGQEIGDLIESGGNQKVIDSQKMALDILDSPEMAEMRKTPGMESAVAAIEKQVETLASNGELTLKEAQKLRQGIDKSINFNKAAPEMRGAQEGLYKQRTAIRDSMNEAIEKANPSAGKDALKIANKRYNNLSEAEDILEKEIGRNQANRAVSLTDTIMTGAGAATGGPVTAVALGAANKFGRTFGNSLQARIYDAISKKSAKIPALTSKVNPLVAQVIAQRTADQRTPTIQKTENKILNNKDLMDAIRRYPSAVESIEDEEEKQAVIRKLRDEGIIKL